MSGAGKALVESGDPGKVSSPEVPVLEAAFERMLRALKYQEFGVLPKPPRLHGRDRQLRWLDAMVTLLHRRCGLDSPATPPARLRLAYALRTAIVRIVLGQFRKLGLRAPAEVDRCVASHQERLQGVTGYTSVVEDDTPVRTALLLRLMGRRADAAAVLVRRWRSGLAGSETRHWLRSFLQVTGEKRAAGILEDVSDVGSRPRPPVGSAASGLRYGIVVTALLDTPTFRRSVQSLVESDFVGEVVVVEDGPGVEAGCRSVAEAYGVRYVRCPSWSGSADAINRGIGSLGSGVDIVIYAHNDVLWPPTWHASLDAAWARVYESDRVAVINLGYLQITRRSDPSVLDLFARGRYDDLLWLLRAMREVPHLMNSVQDAQVRPGEFPFGLARDPWIDWLPGLRLQTGRFSVGASFARRCWDEIGGFDPDLLYAFDLQLLHQSIARRRWTLFASGPPLIHLKSSDTRAVSAEVQAEIGRRFSSMYEAFQRKYGWNIEHYLNLYFSETMVLHQDRIIAAVNRNAFAEIDDVFDDFAERLQSRHRSNCELVWCRTRAACPYVDSSSLSRER